MHAKILVDLLPQRGAVCCLGSCFTSYVHHSRQVMASPGSAMLKYAGHPLKGSRLLQAIKNSQQVIPFSKAQSGCLYADRTRNMMGNLLNGKSPGLKHMLAFSPQPALTPEEVSSEEHKIYTRLCYICPCRTIQSQLPVIDQQPVYEWSQQRCDN